MTEQGNNFAHYMSVSVAFFTGLSFDEWVAAVSLFVALFTSGVNFYFKRQHLKLQEMAQVSAKKQQLRDDNDEQKH